MLRIIVDSSNIDRAEWSALVRDSQTGTWFQTPEAYDFFASQPALFSPFVVAIAKENKSAICNLQSAMSEEGTGVGYHLRGICVGYVTVERSPLRQFFTRRAIIIGGPALADDCSEEEVTILMNAVRSHLRFKIDDCKFLEKKKNIQYSIFNLQCVSRPPIYIETRNFNDYSKWKAAFASAGFDYVSHLNFHVDTSSVETLETNLGKSRKRDIKTTIREGVEIASVYDLRLQIADLERERLVHEYYLILKNLYETKVKTPLFPESFFQALAVHPDGRMLLTMYRGHVIGGTACVMYHINDISNLRFQNANLGEGKSSILNVKYAMTTPDGVVYEWFACGEDGVYPHIFPSCYATYAGMRYAAEHGCSRFDMMGAGRPDEAYGVRDFKAKFGGQQVEHGRYVCVVKPLLYQLGRLGVKVLKRLT